MLRLIAGPDFLGGKDEGISGFGRDDSCGLGRMSLTRRFAYRFPFGLVG